MTFLSVIIPVYNEQKRLHDNMLKKLNFLKNQKYTWELIFVDDGSKDQTSQIIKKFISDNKKYQIKIINIKPNQGKGNAIKSGMLQAKGNFRLFSDLDDSTKMQEIPRLLKYKQNFDVVIGSRYLPDAKITKKQSLIRRLISRMGNLYIRIMLGIDIVDTQCGFKLFSAKSAEKIFSLISVKRWGFDVEALALAKKLNFRIKEVAVDWQDQEGSKVSPLKASLEVFSDVAKVKNNLLIDKYNLYHNQPKPFLVKIFSKKTNRQFVKFAVVGVIGTLIDVGIYNILAILCAYNIYISRSISFTLAATNNYILNRVWTFKSKDKRVARQFGKFFVISLVGLGLNLLIMKMLEDVVSPIENEIIRKNVPVIIAILIVLFWNFFANKYWTFKQKGKK